MPELPDVEVFKRYLDATALHRVIDTAHVRDERLLEGVSASTVRRRLKGSELERSRRHGKLLFAALSEGGWLLLHFGMTGRLSYFEEGEEPEHTALLLDFEDGTQLAYQNQRTFGRIELLEDVDEYLDEKGLGPDPLAENFDLRDFRGVLDGRNGAIKTTLMNQSALSGLGNVYVDELLFRAGIHPESKVEALSSDQVKEIWNALKHVVEKAIDAEVDAERMPRTFLIRRREEGAECPRCDGEVSRAEVGGRSTYFCDACQERAT